MQFSSSVIWNDSLFLRYPVDKIKKIGNLYFYDNDNILLCQNFFEPKITMENLTLLKNEIKNHKKIRFNYINDSETFDIIKKWASKNKYSIEVIDSWDSPLLDVDYSLEKHCKNCSSQVKRNFKNYNNNKHKYKFYNSDSDDRLKLWKYVLTIDNNSWKKREKSDMKSLNREDLQYLPFFLKEQEKSDLVVVCNSDDIPLAYSLMFKDDDGCWFAVKWGASDLGRKNYAGFLCLFNHLEYIYNKEKKIYIDFWGRRNKTYDLLKNKSIRRSHVIIYQKEE